MLAIGARDGKIIYQMTHVLVARMVLLTIPEVLEDLELKDVLFTAVGHTTEDFHGVVLAPIGCSAICQHLS